MATTCSESVVVGTRRDGSPIETACGKWWAGERMFCSSCESAYLEKYPQGWVGYPGDVCRHGRYVGGCGIDHICPQCEYGDD